MGMGHSPVGVGPQSPSITGQGGNGFLQWFTFQGCCSGCFKQRFPESCISEAGHLPTPSFTNALQPEASSFLTERGQWSGSQEVI